MSVNDDCERKRLNLKKYPNISQEFYILAPSRVEDCVKNINNMIIESQYDLIINACDADIYGDFLFQYIMDLVTTDIPNKTMVVFDLTNESLIKGFTNFKDTDEMLSNHYEYWNNKYNYIMAQLHENIDTNLTAHRSSGNRNGKPEIKKNEIWYMSDIDENYLINIKNDFVDTCITFHEYHYLFNK